MIDLKTELFPHQKNAVNKLSKLKVGALYMEMGTGKTRTALELIKLRMEKGKIKQAVWLCPCSVKRNLEDDIRKHADVGPSDILIYGIESISGSARIAADILSKASEKKSMLIVDESNLIKNHRALRSERITRIAERCPYRIILNGTPVSKTEADMFQQWYILDWRILGYRSFYSFAANHIEWDEKFRGQIRRVLNIDYLTDKIAPYSVQIKKEDCLELPAKNYHSVHFDLTLEQKKHYYIVLDTFLDENALDDDGSSVLIYKAFNAAQQVASGERVTSGPREDFKHRHFFEHEMDNPRLKTFIDVVESIGHEKAIVWCRYQHEIDSVTRVLSAEGYSCVEFTGRIQQKERQENIDRFRDDAQFFVANKSCAGYGLNLQFCHIAIYYTNDWDLATRTQSEDRIHRIGQESEVEIYDIMASNTIDIRISDCLQRKENMVEKFKSRLGQKNYAAWLSGKEDEEHRDYDRTDGRAEEV